jgi:hypothetical protein
VNGESRAGRPGSRTHHDDNTAPFPRAQGGWLVIPAGQKSPCPHHYGLCAYSGDEPGTCPRCHVPWADIETGTGPGDGPRAEHRQWHGASGARESRKAARRRSPAMLAPGAGGATS